jgi:hypothetical protein
MTTKFRAAMAKMATLGQNRNFLTDCSGAHLLSDIPLTTAKVAPDVIPVPKTLTTKPFLPAGKTHKDVQVAVRRIYLIATASLIVFVLFSATRLPSRFLLPSPVRLHLLLCVLFTGSLTGISLSPGPATSVAPV